MTPPPTPTNSAAMTDVTPYDAVLLVSFGGPERPDDVLPFLRERHPRPRHPARAAGRGRPSTTPASAASARSTTRTASCSRRSQADLAAHGLDLPVYWGNRNWDPYLADALRQMRADGVTPGRRAS